MKLSISTKLGIGVALICAVVFAFEMKAAPLFALPATVAFLCSAWMLRRGKAWGGYGPALFVLAFPIGILLARTAGAMAIAVAVGLSVAVAAVLFFAGRRLQEPGTKWPWIGFAACTLLFLTAFQPFYMPTSSMEDTLQIGDRLLVNRFATEPLRGGLIVHRYPVDRRQMFIKRVAGMPGDRIRFVDKKLFINGVLAAEPYARHKTGYTDSYRDNFPGGQAGFTPIARGAQMLSDNVINNEVIVPPGKYFVLGDNRDSSLDSRYWGFIDRQDIIGKPVLIYYSRSAAAFRPL